MSYSQTVGGDGGSGFNDNTNKKLTGFSIHCGRVIDGIGAIYEGETKYHGGDGGNAEEFLLMEGEYVTRIEGRSGEVLDAIRFVTNKRVSQLYGGTGGSPFTLSGNGYALQYLSGRSGSRLDSLQAHWSDNKVDLLEQAMPSNYVGGQGGDQFDDSTSVDVSKRVTAITVRHGSRVDAIQVHYDGATAPQHGGNGGDSSTFNLQEDEVIIRVFGRSGAAIDRIQFLTNKGRQSDAYGGDGGSSFNLDCAGKAFKYIEGRCGSILDGFRVFWWPSQPISYELTNVKYTISQLQILSAEPIVVGSGNVTNSSSITQTSTATTEVTEERSSEWNIGVSIMIGAKVKVEAGIPSVAKGEVEVSTEVTTSFNYGQGTSSSRTTTFSVPVSCPPNSFIEFTYVGQKTILDVPYSAQLKIAFSDGTYSTKQVTGVYKGVQVANVSAVFKKEVPTT